MPCFASDDDCFAFAAGNGLRLVRGGEVLSGASALDIHIAGVDASARNQS